VLKEKLEKQDVSFSPAFQTLLAKRGFKTDPEIEAFLFPVSPRFTILS